MENLYTKESLNVWVQALRSGEYRQGRTTLVQQGTDGEKLHCCLGVYADVVNDPRKEDGFSGDIYTDIGELIGDATVDDLWHWNDKGATFNEIAGWIEANLVEGENQGV
jgi:hypothetical protein